MRRLIEFFIVAAVLVGVVQPPAAIAEEVKKVRLLLVPERNVFEQQRKYKVLADYASGRLSFSLSFDVVGSYREVLDLVRRGEAEGAFMGSLIAACGMEQYGLLPLVRPQWLSGESTYSGVVFKNKASSVTADPGSWRGHSIVFSSPHTSAGYFYPLSILRSFGITEPASSFFSEFSFSGSHDTSVWMVAKGMADLGAAKSTVFDEYLKKKPEIAEMVEVLSRGGTYPDAALMFNSKVPPEVLEAIKSLFLGMAKDPAGHKVLESFGAMGFLETKKKDFGDVFNVVELAGFKVKDIDILDRGKDVD